MKLFKRKPECAPAPPAPKQVRTIVVHWIDGGMAEVSADTIAYPMDDSLIVLSRDGFPVLIVNAKKMTYLRVAAIQA